MSARAPAPLAARAAAAVVRTERLGFAYPGGHRALRGVSLALAPGTLTALTGPSGGGKTTLLRALCGLIPHFHGGRMEGRVTLAGADTRAVRPEALGRRAGMLFQDPERQSVHEAVLRDVAFGLGNAGVAPWRMRAAAEAALEEAGAGALIDRRLDELSGGERQRVALAGVIACDQPLVLLDEPASQLDEGGRAALARILARLRSTGRAVVVTDHGRANDLAADQCLYLERGALGASERSPAAGPVAFPTPGGPLLDAAGISVRRGGREVVPARDLILGRGEIRALVGPNGSGKTSLLLALAGVLSPAAGEVVVAGQRVSQLPLVARFPATAFVPQDPRLYFLTESVGAEVALGLAGRGVGTDRAAEALARFDVEGLMDRHPLDLSSGQRVRVALAAAWAQEPLLLLLDEPTRGLDRRARGRLIVALADHARRGGAAVIATHDAALAAALPGDPIALGGPS